jgi:hypothetical protein
MLPIIFESIVILAIMCIFSSSQQMEDLWRLYLGYVVVVLSGSFAQKNISIKFSDQILNK